MLFRSNGKVVDFTITPSYIVDDASATWSVRAANEMGGYRFMDFVKAGFPLIIIATVVSMIILPIAFPFFP